ncbi:hypothetical protein ACFL54_07540 [Planctomycetota bacterium]
MLQILLIVGLARWLEFAEKPYICALTYAFFMGAVAALFMPAGLGLGFVVALSISSFCMSWVLFFILNKTDGFTWVVTLGIGIAILVFCPIPFAA